MLILLLIRFICGKNPKNLFMRGFEMEEHQSTNDKKCFVLKKIELIAPDSNLNPFKHSHGQKTR